MDPLTPFVAAAPLSVGLWWWILSLPPIWSTPAQCLFMQAFYKSPESCPLCIYTALRSKEPHSTLSYTGVSLEQKPMEALWFYTGVTGRI